MLDHSATEAGMGCEITTGSFVTAPLTSHSQPVPDRRKELFLFVTAPRIKYTLEQVQSNLAPRLCHRQRCNRLLRDMVDASRIDIDNTLWDQSTFLGRLKHFFWVTDPRTCIVSESSLDEAKILVEQYRIGKEPPGTTLQQVVYAKKLYESAFHPDTGEKQNVFGRMSFQVPGGMAITGAMLQFYRNAKSSLTPTQLGIAYVSASASALVTAIGCKTFWQKHASPIYQRYVPFAAVAAANCANIPLMRQTELINGVDVFDDKGNKLTESRVRAWNFCGQYGSHLFLNSPSNVRAYFGSKIRTEATKEECREVKRRAKCVVQEARKALRQEWMEML
uniref:Uncharacterized protein n=1 Tax=Timema bartmani TaxID=61472 RepID=A0A7R9ETB9_9NEOP|nr:unnamed protein product [Timema bartmani]